MSNALSRPRPPRGVTASAGAARSGALLLAAWLSTWLTATPARAQTTEGPGRPAPASARCELGLSIGGGTGLFDLPLADAGCPWRLRVGTWLYGFAQSDYLTIADRNTQLEGGLQVGATLGQHVETWITSSARANRDARPSSSTSLLGSSAPTLALGRTALGLKLHGAWGPRRILRLGAQAYLRVHSGPDDVGPNFASLDFGVDLLGTVDLSAWRPQLPVRLHAAVGYLQDRSSRLLTNFDCRTAGSDECLAARLIYTAAYSVGQPRMQLAIGADARFQVDPRVALGALVSYHASVVVTDGDPVLVTLLRLQQPDANIDRRVAQWLTLGGRVFLPLPMTIELGVQIGVMSAGYALGAKQPAAAGYGALTWELDLLGGRREPRSDEGPRVQPTDAAAGASGEPSSRSARGAIRGVVRDASSATPLADAVVRFVGTRANALLTNDRGEFVSGPLPVGPVAIEASRGDHQTARTIVLVRPGETAAREIALSPTPRAAPGSLWLALSSDSGPLATETVSATLAQAKTGQTIELRSPPSGSGLVARVPAGTWLLRVDAAGFLSREQLVAIPDGGERRVSLRLSRRPPLPRAQLSADEVVLSEPLAFAAAGPAPDAAPELTEASGALLDELVDVLVHHPEIRHVRIEYSPGAPGEQALLERQVIAVRDHLVQRGVAPERVVASEAGSGRPRTRRISFKIAP